MTAIKISNTNGNARQRDVVRAYRDGQKIAETFVPSRNPLRYLRAHPGSAYRAHFAGQLAAAGVPAHEIAAILA